LLLTIVKILLNVSVARLSCTTTCALSYSALAIIGKKHKHKNRTILHVKLSPPGECKCCVMIRLHYITAALRYSGPLGPLP